MANATIGVRVSISEKEKILTLVKEGKYLNPSDFMRTAAREKLKVEAESA